MFGEIGKFRDRRDDFEDFVGARYASHLPNLDRHRVLSPL
jgi:hypothetical protein